jgi:AcrR family transcriptional regulator
MKKVRRPYVMKARAETAAATRGRVIATTRRLLLRQSFEDMTVDAIAAGAQTTVRTVLRMFRSKELLFAEALHSLGELGQAPIVPGNIDAMLTGTYDFYEKVGDTVVRWLADEARVPALHDHLEIGRGHLRNWVAQAFAAEMAACPPDGRRDLHDALIVAFDVYTWKLLRRDFGLARAAAQAVVHRMVAALTREVGDGKHPLAQLVRRGQSSAQSRHSARSD